MNDQELLEYINDVPYSRYRGNDKIWKEIDSYLLRNTNISLKDCGKPQSIYIIKHGLVDIPKCHCGNPVRYHNGKYQKHCSLKCSANDKQTKALKKKTNLKKYGVENVFQSKTVQTKIKKTNIEKYGAENPFSFGSENFKRTLKLKYGVDNASRIPTHKEKTQHKNYERAFNGFKRFADEVVPLFGLKDYNGCGYDKIYSWRCVKCGNDFKAWYNFGWTPKCPVCYPSSSNFQKEIEKYLSELKIDYKRNVRNIIPPLELDIYIPSLNLAIECNGNYWHSELGGGKNKEYHLLKTKMGIEKGISVIQIFEDEWLYNKKLIESKLKYLTHNVSNKIYARKCVVKKVSHKESSTFLSAYHIQGKDNSKYRYGLYHQEKLIALMTFSKRRFDNQEGYELVRYATITSHSVVGGAGKLLAHFERTHAPNIIISYADRRWSVGNLYYKLGFNFIRYSTPSYYYMKKGKYLERFNRINFQKHKLKNKLESFDPSATEWENMKANGYDRIWDCGNYVFEKRY